MPMSSQTQFLASMPGQDQIIIDTRRESQKAVCFFHRIKKKKIHEYLLQSVQINHVNAEGAL